MKKLIRPPDHPLVASLELYSTGTDWYASVQTHGQHAKLGPYYSVKKCLKAARQYVEFVLMSHELMTSTKKAGEA